jgi:hypothetical protein
MNSNETQDDNLHAEFDLDSIPKPSLNGHGWVQMGFELICQTCVHPHAVILRPGYHYQGNDEKGQPIIKKVW